MYKELTFRAYQVSTNHATKIKSCFIFISAKKLIKFSLFNKFNDMDLYLNRI